MVKFTFIIIEKNGSGTFTESFEPDTKEELKQFDEELTKKMNNVYGERGWRYEDIQLEEGEMTEEIQSWFDELGFGIEIS